MKMKRRADFGCLPTAIGSMPHKDPLAACREITRYLRDIPAWPQLPARSFLESQYAQFSEGFPGLDVADNHFIVEHTSDFEAELEKLYQAYLSGDADCCPTTKEYAAGLHALVSWPGLSPVALKGQLTGPITFGLGVTDAKQRPIIYDDALADATAKFLHLKAAWQERALKTVSKRTIIFVDEPSMSYFGSAFVSLTRDKVTSLLNDVFSGISGIRGLHCCSNTDWPVLLETETDIISFDAYGYAKEFALYPAEVGAFLKQGGTIAWGIVPNNESILSKESVNSLRDRLDEAMAPFSRKGIPYRQLLEQALVTPSCALAGLSVDAAGQALELLANLSHDIRSRHSLQ